jgi:hypothetical protein
MTLLERWFRPRPGGQISTSHVRRQPPSQNAHRRVPELQKSAKSPAGGGSRAENGVVVTPRLPVPGGEFGLRQSGPRQRPGC